MYQKMETNELIINASLELLKTTALNKVKVTDVVKMVGISRSTFYTYFDSVYDVIEQMERDIINGMPVNTTKEVNQLYSDGLEELCITLGYIKKMLMYSKFY